MNEEMKMTELKIKILLSLRQNVTNALIVLIGGVVGMCFMPDTILKYIFIAVGIFYAIILMKNLYYAETGLKDILQRKTER